MINPVNRHCFYILTALIINLILKTLLYEEKEKYSPFWFAYPNRSDNVCEYFY